MKLSSYIKKIIFENINHVNQLLDKVSKHGQQSLTPDEKTYLNQYNNNSINNNLEDWLFSDDDDTFNLNGDKLLFDEFTENEDIFYNREKLIRVINKHLGKIPFTNNSDWGGAYVWNVNTDNKFVGKFLYLDDNDELVLLKRIEDNDEYRDEVLKTIKNSKDLYNFFLSLKKH